MSPKMTAEKIARNHGMMSIGEVELLKGLVSNLPQKPIAVNIGSGAGTSVVAILETRPDVFCFDVDIVAQETARRMIDASGLRDEDRYAFILGKSWKVGRNWPFPIDLLFIDGAHTEDAVRRDIAAWLDKVNPGGFVAFHDYQHQKAPGVTLVVDEEMQTHERIGLNRYLVAFRVIG